MARQLKPVSTAFILQRWISLHPTRRIDAQFWLRVDQELRRTVQPPVTQATDEEVRRAIATIEDEDLRNAK